jgi:hypothetical protein
MFMFDRTALFYDPPEGHPGHLRIHFYDLYPINVSRLNFNIFCLLLL